MDSIEIIILIAFLLFSLLGRSKKKKKRPAPQPAGDKKKQPSFFEEILRELEEKAQQATKPTPVPVEADPEESLATQPAPREDPFAQEEAFTRAEQGHTPHEEHGFGPDNPFSEEAFEQLPLDPPPPPHEAGHLVDTPHVSLGKPLPRPDAGASSAVAGRWRRRLQNPQSARDAIVLKEIFDGPRTLR